MGGVRCSLRSSAATGRTECIGCAEGGGPRIVPCSPEVGCGGRGVVGGGRSHPGDHGGQTPDRQEYEEEEEEDDHGSILTTLKKSRRARNQEEMKSPEVADHPWGPPWKGDLVVWVSKG